jgi:uncharacterized membrane protein
MTKVLEKLSWAVLAGTVLSILLLGAVHGNQMGSVEQPVTRFIHVVAGIIWIGLLYYFNFVQIPTMPKVPAELKPGVTKYIAPEALFWFRWAAIATVLIGLALAHRLGYLVQALTLQQGFALIGAGMWLGLIMAFNVWVFIWPNQQRALGLVEADADTKAKSARTAMLFSRTNFVLSFPMLYSMTAYQSLPA